MLLLLWSAQLLQFLFLCVFLLTQCPFDPGVAERCAGYRRLCEEGELHLAAVVQRLPAQPPAGPPRPGLPPDSRDHGRTAQQSQVRPAFQVRKRMFYIKFLF